MNQYQSWCMNCCSTFHPDMLSGYFLTSRCDRCGRHSDLAMVKVRPSQGQGGKAMTRLTALIIHNKDVYAGAIGPVDGKHGIYIETLEESPSGSMRPRPLLTGPHIYATADEACLAGEDLIRGIKAKSIEDIIGEQPLRPSRGREEKL